MSEQSFVTELLVDLSGIHLLKGARFGGYRDQQPSIQQDQRTPELQPIIEASWLLKDESKAARTSYLDALSKVEGNFPELASGLSEAYCSEGKELRRRIIPLFEKVGSASIPVLLGFFESSDSAERKLIVQTLGHLGQTTKSADLPMYLIYRDSPSSGLWAEYQGLALAGQDKSRWAPILSAQSWYMLTPYPQQQAWFRDVHRMGPQQLKQEDFYRLLILANYDLDCFLGQNALQFLTRPGLSARFQEQLSAFLMYALNNTKFEEPTFQKLLLRSLNEGCLAKPELAWPLLCIWDGLERNSNVYRFSTALECNPKASPALEALLAEARIDGSASERLQIRALKTLADCSLALGNEGRVLVIDRLFALLGVKSKELGELVISALAEVQGAQAEIIYRSGNIIGAEGTSPKLKIRACKLLGALKYANDPDRIKALQILDYAGGDGLSKVSESAVRSKNHLLSLVS